MGSSSPYMFMFTSLMLMSIQLQTCFCGGSEQYVNCNRPFLCANIQTLHRILRFTVLPPQLAVPSRQLAEAPQPGTVTRSEQRQIVAVSSQSPTGNDDPFVPLPAPQPVESSGVPAVFPQSLSPTPFINSPAPQLIVPSGVQVFPQSLSPTPFINSPAPQLIVPSGVPEPPSKSNWWLKIVIGISAAVAGIVVMSFVFIVYNVKRGQYFSSNAMVLCWESGAKNYQINNEEIIKNYGSIAPKRYTYSDVKKLTNSFKDKVGQGGYGVVYKGKLPDGRMVAVKILSTSKGNGEEFINEVASISKTSHINIVTLLGFCYERTKRALIYEFMPNRSLDKSIYNKGSTDPNCHLDNKTMFQIAVGIARGLEYLHRGCNTRILHFDIKPHNILLDEDLCPKISDFGLAKLCKTKESIVSMTGMRGTVGFIAPEVFSRSFGVVSHKSDVYSYGM